MLKPWKCREKNHKIKSWIQCSWDLEVKLHKINAFLVALLVLSLIGQYWTMSSNESDVQESSSTCEVTSHTP